MRRSIIITVLVIGLLGVRFVALPRFALHLAKARAVKKYADGKWGETLKTVPKSPPDRLAAAVEYTNTVWLEPTNTGCALGFPSDTFTRDGNPKRQNTVVHHARYRVLALRGAVIRLGAGGFLAAARESRSAGPGKRKGMKRSANKRAGGDGGIRVLFHAGRHWPAAAEFLCWADGETFCALLCHFWI